MRQIDSERLHGKVADIILKDFLTLQDKMWMVGRVGETSLQQINSHPTAVENRADIESVLDELITGPLIKTRGVLCV